MTDTDRRTRRAGAVTCVAALLLVSTFARSVGAQDTEVRWATVSYLSGGSVYVDAGTKAGLKEGQLLEVVRQGAVIAQLAVAYISSSRSSCTIVRSSDSPAYGDSVRFTVARSAGTTAAGVATGVGTGPVAPIAARRSASASSQRLRGRVGLRYLVIEPGNGMTLTQPALDLRLEGQHLGGSPIGLVVDVRAQQSRYASADSGAAAVAPTTLTRAYQVALQWNVPGSPTRISLGRQYAMAVPAIGIFDGAALDVDGARWSTGIFGGTQPEARNFGLSNETREYGGYLQLHNRPAAGSPWNVTVGGVGSYTFGEIDREFGFVQLMVTGRRFSLYAVQELDVNRGWRQQAEGSAFTPTSTFATAQLTIVDGLAVNAGVDNRRSVRLYRDYVNPEIAFDDAFRQGWWGGTTLSLWGHLRASVDSRTSSGGPAGSAQSLTTTFNLVRFTPLQLGAHVRSTRYSGLASSGSLESASVEANPFSAFRVEVTSGRRQGIVAGGDWPSERYTWTGVDADMGIGRSLYLMISTNRERSATNQTSQSYVAVSWRF